MHVLIDGSTFENSHQIGVQRYFRETLSRVARTERVSISLETQPRASLPTGCSIVRRLTKRGEIANFDLFHSTRFTRSLLRGLPEVLTIHDMIPEVHWKFLPGQMDAEVAAKREAGDAARRILCASHATAADVRAVYPAWSDKLRVVHYGADHVALTGDRGNHRPPASFRRFWRQWRFVRQGRQSIAFLGGKPYVLFIGDRWVYKNFGVLLDAMAQKSWSPDLLLAVVGPPFTEEELGEIGQRHLSGKVVLVGRVSDSQLHELYGNATCFAFPSRAEGFGFPLLEAQLAGAALICSDIAVFRELAETHARFCSPDDPDAWATAAAALLHQPLSKEEKTAARQNASRFTWDKCAAETLDVYRQIVSGAIECA